MALLCGRRPLVSLSVWAAARLASTLGRAVVEPAGRFSERTHLISEARNQFEILRAISKLNFNRISTEFVLQNSFLSNLSASGSKQKAAEEENKISPGEDTQLKHFHESS